MRTLYLRNVPDEVVDRLERMAKLDGMSVNAFAVRELSGLSRRADNAAILGALPSLAVDPSEIVADLDAGRSDR